MAGARVSGIRTLRWCYRRDGEMLTCALALTADYTAYELRVSPPGFPLGPASELFDDAVSAFQRQSTFERALLEQGWSLERFDEEVSAEGDRERLTA